MLIITTILLRLTPNEFKYGVKDPHIHDIKEQVEKRDGDKVEVDNSLYIIQLSNTTSNIYLIINEWATSFGH